MVLVLTQTITSNKNKTLYGNKGEEVTLIAEHGDVLIVEGKRGKFPVHKSKTEKKSNG